MSSAMSFIIQNSQFKIHQSNAPGASRGRDQSVGRFEGYDTGVSSACAAPGLRSPLRRSSSSITEMN